MNEKEFKAIILAYSSDDIRWPDPVRDEALSFAESSKGKAILDQESALDALLDHASMPEQASTAFMNSLIELSNHSPVPMPAMKESLLNYLRQQMPELASWLRPSALIAQGATLSMALVMGMWVGGQQAIAEDMIEETDLSYSLFSEDMVLEDDLEDWNEY